MKTTGMQIGVSCVKGTGGWDGTALGAERDSSGSSWTPFSASSCKRVLKQVKCSEIISGETEVMS